MSGPTIRSHCRAVCCCTQQYLRVAGVQNVLCSGTWATSLPGCCFALPMMVAPEDS